MINFGLNPASFLGIILAIAGAGLLVLRSVRPELSRDQDIAFTAIGIICGFILMFQGWRLDPILQFGQFLLSGSAIFFAYESIKLRGIATEQAKGKTQIVDEERPVSRRYKAEIEDREYLDDRPRNSRRIRGDDRRSSNEREDRDDLPRRRSATRELPEDRVPAATPRRRREVPDRSEANSLARRPNTDRWDSDDDWNEPEPARPRRALPDADLARTKSERRSRNREEAPPERHEPKRDRRRDEIPDIDDPAATPRRQRPDRRTSSDDRQRSTSEREDTRELEGTIASYVDYEPIADADGKPFGDEPPSGLPPSSTEPIIFPDRY
jgi:hypothetical protein